MRRLASEQTEVETRRVDQEQREEEFIVSWGEEQKLARLASEQAEVETRRVKQEQREEQKVAEKKHRKVSREEAARLAQQQLLEEEERLTAECVAE